MAGSYQQIVEFLDSGLSDLARASEDIASTTREDAAKTTVASARRQVMAAAGAAIVVGLLLAVLIASGITRGLAS